jgi:hypothetical protein
LLGASVFVVFADGPAWPFRLATLVFVVAEVEELAITSVLREWQADVPTLRHALARRRRGTLLAIPAHRRPLFALLERFLPDVDRERVWNALDVRAPVPGERLLEERLDAMLRRMQPLVVVFTFGVLTAGVWLVWHVGPCIAASGPRALRIATPIVAAVVLHAVFILVVHEATHGNVLRRPADDWLGSVACGLLLLPFTAEVFQPVHRIHHRLANRPGDTNWSPLRARLFARSRLLYALYELVPVVNGLDRVRGRHPRNARRLAAAWAAAFLTWLVFRPTLVYWMLVVAALNGVTTLRSWVEHFGFDPACGANTYWFPLSFGIGNHEVHHAVPRLSALALSLGLPFRAKDRLVVVAPLLVLFSGRYRHYSSFTGIA